MKRVVTPENASGQRADRRALAEINDLIDDGVYDAASVLAWEVQRDTPGDPTVWLLLARIDYLRERYAAAMYAARMATRLDPSSAAAWFALASTAVTRSRWRAEGLDAALQATGLAPGKAKNWTVLAQLQLAGGAQYEAAVAAERAVRVDPSYRGGHLMLGEIALEAGEWVHAEAAFRRALELDASDRDARDGLTEALEAQGRDPAEELARYGAATEPDEPATRHVLTTARSLVARGGGRTAGRRGPPLLVVVGTVAVGLLLGAVVPGLGVVRGLVGAAAVILMWVAVRPARPGSRVQPEPDQPAAEPADAGEAAPSATSTPDHDAEEPRVAGTADDAAVDDAAVDGEPGVVEPADDAAVDGEPGVVAAVDDAPTRTEEPTVVPAGADADAARTQTDDGGAADGHAASPAGDEDGRAPAGTGPPVDADRPPAATAEPAPAADAHEDIGFDIPDDPAELAELSRVRLAASDLELAHAAASRLEAVAPGSIEAHRALGAVALAEHDYEQARLHYRQVLEIEPLDQEAHERLALAADGLQRSAFRLPLRRFRGRR